MSDSIWQHNVTKGTIPPPKKTSYFDLIYIYICSTLTPWTFRWSDDLWSSLSQAATRLAAVSTEVPPPLATGKPSSSWFNVCASYHAIQVNHMSFSRIIYYIWIHCSKSHALNETKANGPGNSSCMPSNNEGTLQVTIIGASVHKCQHLHTSRLFFGAAEPPLERDSMSNI